MLVSELIEFLQKQPPNLLVAYQKYSEQCLLEADEIRIEDKCHPRPDGWVQDKRPDMDTTRYLLFPGN